MKILSLATLLSKQTTKFINRHENDEVFVLSPLEDDELFSRVKNHHFLKYEIDALGFVLALVCARLIPDFIEIDDGYLSGESNAGDEEIDTLCEYLKACDGIIVAPENFSASNASNIKYMLDILSKKLGFDIIGINGKPYDLGENLSISELEDGADFNGACAFCLPCENPVLKGSAMFAMAAKLKDGSEKIIKTQNGEINVKFELDNSLKGTCGLLFAPSLEYGFIKL